MFDKTTNIFNLSLNIFNRLINKVSIKYRLYPFLLTFSYFELNYDYAKYTDIKVKTYCYVQVEGVF